MREAAATGSRGAVRRQAYARSAATRGAARWRRNQHWFLLVFAFFLSSCLLAVFELRCTE